MTRERVVVEHPLQPFDLRNFESGALVSERTWSFDRVALGGARALAGERVGAPPFLAGEGRIMLEFGDGQEEAVPKILSEHNWAVEAIGNDYSQRSRIVIAHRANW